MNEQSMLTQISDGLAGAVERAGAGTVTVYGRRRHPATGIAWSDDGLILTASHVVEREEDLKVGPPDGTTVEATFVARDPGSDVALIRVSRPVPPMERASSPARPGHLVLAVGRPDDEGLQASFGGVSVVSGPWKTKTGLTVDGFIRADVAMLPGFSGGPLVDTEGRLVGMTSSHLGRGGGMALPVKALEALVATLLEHGKVRRGYLGIGAQAVPLPEALKAHAAEGQEHGLIVVMVEQGGPAEGAGLMIGDVLLSVAGAHVGAVEDLQRHLSGDRVGTEVAVVIVRGGQRHELAVTVGERS